MRSCATCALHHRSVWPLHTAMGSCRGTLDGATGSNLNRAQAIKQLKTRIFSRPVKNGQGVASLWHPLET